jgi:hypothetical protein
MPRKSERKAIKTSRKMGFLMIDSSLGRAQANLSLEDRRIRNVAPEEPSVWAKGN